MLINLPDGLTQDNRDRLILPGQVMVIDRDATVYTLEWQLNSAITTLRLDFATRQVEIPDEADPAQIQALQATLMSFGQPPDWDAAARQILDLAQSAVGMDIRTLTDNQRWALLAVLMWDRKAIDNNLTVRSLREWVRRSPDG